MNVRFILAIFIQMFHKRSVLDLEVLHRVFRIVLAIRYEEETEYQDLQTLYLEILGRVQFGLVMTFLKDLYNEFKFEATMEMNLNEKVYFNLSFLIGFQANYIRNQNWADPPVSQELFSFFLNFEWDSLETQGELTSAHTDLTSALVDACPYEASQFRSEFHHQEGSLLEEPLEDLNSDIFSEQNQNSPQKSQPNTTVDSQV